MTNRRERRKAARSIERGHPARAYDALQPDVRMVPDGDDIFIEADGVRIAKRGKPDTPQAMTWISIEPGWRVADEPGGLRVERLPLWQN